jgi:hypothetical protein
MNRILILLSLLVVAGLLNGAPNSNHLPLTAVTDTLRHTIDTRAVFPDSLQTYLVYLGNPYAPGGPFCVAGEIPAAYVHDYPGRIVAFISDWDYRITIRSIRDAKPESGIRLFLDHEGRLFDWLHSTEDDGWILIVRGNGEILFSQRFAKTHACDDILSSEGEGLFNTISRLMGPVK